MSFFPDGKHRTRQARNAIAGEEALSSKFDNSQLTVIDGKITNVATFNEEEDIPNDIKLLDHDAAPPDGYSEEWSGVMLIFGVNRVVTLYRKN